MKRGVFFFKPLPCSTLSRLCASDGVCSHDAVLLLVLRAEYVALGLPYSVCRCGVLGGRGLDGGDGVNKSTAVRGATLGGVLVGRGGNVGDGVDKSMTTRAAAFAAMCSGWDGCLSMLGVCLLGFEISDLMF